MRAYVVIDQTHSLEENVEHQFSDQDRCKVDSNGWLARSHRLTSAEVASDLGIAVGSKSGIGVTVNHYAGAAHRGIVGKLAVWERL